MTFICLQKQSSAHVIAEKLNNFAKVWIFLIFGIDWLKKLKNQKVQVCHSTKFKTNTFWSNKFVKLLCHSTKFITNTFWSKTTAKMSSFWSHDTRFKRTEIAEFPSFKNKLRTEDSEFWRHLQQPVTIREFGPVQKVDICPSEPYYVAVTGSSRVQIFNPLNNSVYKTLSKFRETALGGKFRKDGKLLCVGGDDGSVKIFDVSSKTLLRTLTGHTNATHVSHFLGAKEIASFSDDKTVRIWDISTEEEVLQFNKHTVSVLIEIRIIRKFEFF